MAPTRVPRSAPSGRDAASVWPGGSTRICRSHRRSESGMSRRSLSSLPRGSRLEAAEPDAAEPLCDIWATFDAGTRPRCRRCPPAGAGSRNPPARRRRLGRRARSGGGRWGLSPRRGGCAGEGRRPTVLGRVRCQAQGGSLRALRGEQYLRARAVPAVEWLLRRSDRASPSLCAGWSGLSGRQRRHSVLADPCFACDQGPAVQCVRYEHSVEGISMVPGQRTDSGGDLWRERQPVDS